MGLGDQLLGAGMARDAWNSRQRKVAFGDGRRIIWDHNSETIFQGNPNIARPGEEHRKDLEWVAYYKGHRIYNRDDRLRRRWIWNRDFRAKPGEIYLTAGEKMAGKRAGEGFILVEPHVEGWKSVAPNKDWGAARYQAVADRLIADGHRLVQFGYDKGGAPLKGVEVVQTKSFRDALAVMSNAALYLGPEGGLHHGAAAVGVRGVVIFGGFIPPEVTGYETHANLTGGAEACGSYKPCAHCRAAMDKISVEEVHAAARTQLSWK